MSGMSNNHRDLRGHRNGKLVGVEPVGVHNGGHVLWKCQCDCGGSAIVQSNNLTRPAGTRSCGCLRRDASRRRLKRDGAWNEGKSYAIAGGEHCYKNRAAWAKAAIRKFGNGCQLCGWDKARCDVHHIIKKSDGGLHTLSNARVLCPNCHRIEHERGHP